MSARIKTYLITLGDSNVIEDKLRYLTNAGITRDNITVVPGVRVNSGNIDELNRENSQLGVSKRFAKLGPYSVIGCAMAHLKAWNTFLTDPQVPEYGMIFEDDVIIPRDTIIPRSDTIIPRDNRFMERVMELVDSTPADFDVLYLGTMGSEGTPNLFTAVMSLFGIADRERRINDKIKQPSVALGTHGCILSRRGAERLLELLGGQVNFHIDFCMQRLASLGKIKVYAASPRIVYQTSTDTCQSENLSLSSNHPLLVTGFFSNFQIDDYVRADYPLRVSIMRVGDTDINLNVISVLFFIAGIIAAYRGIDKTLLAYVFIFLSIPDIVLGFGGDGNGILLVHFILFMLPSLSTRLVK